MKRTMITGLSALVLSALTATAAKAENRVEAQLRLTHPNQTAIRTVDTPTEVNQRQTAASELNNRVQTTDKQPVTRLSERDRLILQYQTQTIIPAESR